MNVILYLPANFRRWRCTNLDTSHSSYLFEKETTPYESLEENSCHFVLRFYGTYQLNFLDRGILYDNTINVIMLQWIRGTSLSKVINGIDADFGKEEMMEKSSYDRKTLDDLVDSLYSSLDSIHASGVVHQINIPRRCSVKKEEKGSYGPISVNRNYFRVT